MLRLRFGAPGEQAPAAPAVGAPGVNVWRNRRGGVVACGFERGGYRWMYWPFLATFRFRADDPCITAFPESDAPIDVVWDTFRRSVLPMALQANGFEALHASAILSREHVIAFCAASETGKSTIAYGLHRRGFPQWADDGVVFQMDHDAATAIPLPFRVRLRPGSQRLLGVGACTTPEFEGNGPGDQLHTNPAPLGAICLLTRTDPGSHPAPFRARRIAPADAFPLVLAHAHVFDPDDTPRRERMLRAYLEVLSAVPVVEVAFAPVSDRVGELLEFLERTFDLALPSSGAARRAS